MALDRPSIHPSIHPSSNLPSLSLSLSLSSFPRPLPLPSPLSFPSLPLPLPPLSSSPFLSFPPHTAWSQEEKDSPTPTELRGILGDPARVLEERVQAYFDLAPVLTDKKESIALIDLLLEEPLTGDQRVELTVKKAELFRASGKDLEGIDLLSQLLETELKDVDRHRWKLLLERGTLESKLGSNKLEKSVSQTLDDLHEALAIAEEMDDVDMKIESHNRLGNAYYRYRDFKTAEAHYGYTLLNYATPKQLALARLNTTFWMILGNPTGTRPCSISRRPD